jgi:hypothetical protein
VGYMDTLHLAPGVLGTILFLVGIIASVPGTPKAAAGV